jgi:hypothetical protein
MKRRPFVIAPLCLAAPAALPGRAAAQGAAAAGIEVAGVRYAPSQALAGASLQLNGAGIRYRFVVKVYTAGLYLAAKAATPDAVLAATGPKRLHVVMLRDIDANELGRLFTKGMQDNNPREEFAKSIPGTLRLGEIFAAKKHLAPGESFSVDWVPGQGTTIVVNGKAQGEPIKEPEFFNGLMRIWLGPNPADAQLKDALLGKEAPRPGGQQP